jgi:hypothetical protein
LRKKVQRTKPQKALDENSNKKIIVSLKTIRKRVKRPSISVVTSVSYDFD